MTFEPGGDPRIPNQMPLPGQSSAAESAPQRRPEDLSRVLVRVSILHGILLMAAVVAVYVLRLVDPERGIWIVLAVAIVTAIHMVTTVLRFQRSAAASPSNAGHPGTGQGSADAYGAPAAAGGNLASPAAGAGVAAGAGQGLRYQVEDVFTITGRGTVVTGVVAAGTAASGQRVLITRGGQTLREATIGGVELVRKMVDTAAVGDRAGLLLPDVGRSEVTDGDVIVEAAPPDGAV